MFLGCLAAPRLSPCGLRLARVPLRAPICAWRLALFVGASRSTRLLLLPEWRRICHESLSAWAWTWLFAEFQFPWCLDALLPPGLYIIFCDCLKHLARPTEPLCSSPPRCSLSVDLAGGCLAMLGLYLFPYGVSCLSYIGVLFGCFARKIDGPGLPGFYHLVLQLFS